MIESSSQYELSLPSLNLAADTMFSYHGPIQCNGAIIRIPGLPSNNYYRINVFGGQHDVHQVLGEYIQLRTDLRKMGDFSGYFNSGYAYDDGRNKMNWRIDGLQIQDITAGRIRFRDKMTVGRAYRLTTVNDILLDTGAFLVHGTSYDFYCKVNFEPTMVESVTAEPGVITIEFSDDIEQEGSVAGIDYDYLKYEDNKLFIYTTASGEFRLQLSDFFDSNENPIEDYETDISVPVNNETVADSDGVYSVKYRSRYDYEDIVLSRGYEWLRRNGIQ